MNRNTTRRGFIIVAALMTGFLCLAASAFASGAVEHALGASAAVNPQTCKFVKAEVDPSTGPTWKNLRQYVIYEDARHDAKLSCLTRKIGTFKAPKPDTCFAQNGPVPATAEAPADKQGYHDTQGLNALRAWVSKLATCEANR